LARSHAGLAFIQASKSANATRLHLGPNRRGTGNPSGMRILSRCHLGIALLPPKIKPQYRAWAEQSFLRSLSPDEARRVAGGQGRLERALKGESLESIYNAGQDPLYRWKTLGEV